MTDGDKLNQEIADILAGPGNGRRIPQTQTNRIIIAMLADIRKAQSVQNDRIAKVEAASIVLWVQRNKAIATFIMLALVLLDALGLWPSLVRAGLAYVGLDVPPELIGQ